MLSNSKNDWNDLAAKAQGGDKQSYAVLLKEVAPYIRHVALKTMKDRDGVDDLVQEVLISVHKALPSYSADRPFKPWLMAIFSFRRTDWFRQYYSRRAHAMVPEQSIDWDQSSFVTNAQYAGELKDIEKAFEEIPATQKSLFMMMRVEGFSAQEIAEKTGMSVSAVKVSVHRTAAKLKERLGS